MVTGIYMLVSGHQDLSIFMQGFPLVGGLRGIGGLPSPPPLLANF